MSGTHAHTLADVGFHDGAGRTPPIFVADDLAIAERALVRAAAGA